VLLWLVVTGFGRPSADEEPTLPAKPSTYRANAYAGVVRSALECSGVRWNAPEDFQT